MAQAAVTLNGDSGSSPIGSYGICGEHSGTET